MGKERDVPVVRAGHRAKEQLADDFGDDLGLLVAVQVAVLDLAHLRGSDLRVVLVAARDGVPTRAEALRAFTAADVASGAAPDVIHGRARALQRWAEFVITQSSGRLSHRFCGVLAAVLAALDVVDSVGD